jgi:hypothetical protein
VHFCPPPSHSGRRPRDEADVDELFVVARVAVGLANECLYAHMCESHNKLTPTPLSAIAMWRVTLQRCVGLDPQVSVTNATRQVVTFVQRKSYRHR